ncbi:MAG TPA: hypothetical protein VKZ50_02615 [bacterium]|nr:hypothetical protein [bacterium]
MIVMNARDQIRELQAFFDLSEAKLGQVLGVRERTIGQWRSGGLAPQGVDRLELERILAVKDLLVDRYKSVDKAREWLNAPTMAFGGPTPLKILLSRSVSDVLGYLEMPDEAVYS